MTAEELAIAGAEPVLYGALVAGAARLLGRGGGGRRKHARIRAAEAAAVAAAERARQAARAGRVFRYDQPVYATQPPNPQPITLPGVGPVGPFAPWLNLYFWIQDMRASNELARAQAQQAVDASSPWYARGDVFGPPGPYELGAFYGLNFPLIEGSRQDPRGIASPPFRTLTTAFLTQGV